MKCFMTPKPTVVVDMQTAYRALTANDLECLCRSWIASTMETEGRELIGACLDDNEKVMYFTFKTPTVAQDFKLHADQALDHAVAFFSTPREMPPSVEEMLDDLLGPAGIDPLDPTLPE